MRVRSFLPAATLLALAAAATACGGSSSPTATVTPAANGSTGSTSSSSTSSAAPSTSDTSASASGTQTAAAGSACSASSLTASEVSEQAATGHDQLVIALTNTGTSSCTLTGYPKLSLLAAGGSALPTTVHDGKSYTFPQAPVTTVTLAPKAEASFDVGFDEIPQTSSDVCQQASALAITPPGASSALQLSVNIRACQNGHLDVSPVVSGSAGVQ